MLRFQREINALNAYCLILKNNGVKADELRECRLTILALIPFLQNLHLSGRNYRIATHEFLQLLSESERGACIPTIREYFAFWMNDVQTIVIMNKGGDFESNSEGWSTETIESIEAILDAMPRFELTGAERGLLQVYEKALPKRSHDKFFIRTHLRLASYLLFRLRKISPKNVSDYRPLIDECLTVFTSKDDRRVFLTVARQMYYHWSDEVHATVRNQDNAALVA